MGFFARLLDVVAPQKAYEREAWRQSTELLRSYDAAGLGRLNAGWRAHNDSGEMTDRPHRDLVRARARDLERNSDIFQSVIQAYKRNLIGKGYTLQAKTGDDALDTQIERQWKQWCRAENCDVTGAQSFHQLLRMAVVRKKVDGGILFVKRYVRGGLLPLRLQMIEVDELDTTAVTPKHQGNVVVGGIEYDVNRRAVGYFIRQYDMDGWQTVAPVYVDAKDVIFYRTKIRPTQLREISDLASSITRVRDTNEFITAVSVKERIAACLAVFIKKKYPEGAPPGRYHTTDESGRRAYTGKSLTPGMIREMNVGDEIQVVDPKNAGSDASQFLKMTLGLISAGQGLSYESVSRDMSRATYSSARQAAIEDEGTFAEEIELLTDVMSEIYEAFLLSGYLAGMFKMPDFCTRKTEYLSHTWVKTPKKWIDPLKESNANRIALLSGQKTFQDICAEYGKDWREAIGEMAEVLEAGTAQGIDMGGVLFGNVR